MDSLNRPNFKERFLIDRVLKYVVDIVIALMLAVLFITSMAYTTTAKGNSMAETIHAEDDILVNKLAFKLFNPQKGDVVLFMEKDGQTQSVKRIVGTPGDSLVIKDGVLLINNNKQSYINNEEAIITEGICKNEIVLLDDEYFVIGDNWNNSTDSRYEDFGFVSKRDMIGKVWFVVAPFKHFRFV